MKNSAEAFKERGMRKLNHPLWVQLPALAALVFLIVRLVMAGPLPAEAPVHFGFTGAPDEYGSPWLSFGITLGLSVFFIVFSAFMDEVWAGNEKAKRFNWFSLLDEIVVGALAGTSLGYLDFLEAGAVSFSFPWAYVLGLAGAAAVLGVLLELARPFRPRPQRLAAEDEAGLREELAKRLGEGGPFIYWESQNPLYVTLLSVVLPLVMVVSAVFAWFDEPWAGLLLLVVGVAFITMYGGLRTLVTQEAVTVRLGFLGIRVLRLPVSEVIAAELHEFTPLGDFGGYGIRFGRGMTAYFMRGTRGVKLTTVSGRKYLIGSDRAERLLAVLQAVTGLR
jgi:hypothetical protein